MNKNPTDTDEQFKLGLCYLNGDGVPQDMKKAVYWITEAAKQDHAEAQSFLGDSFNEMGNIKKAAYWWAKAAEQGDASAQNNVGICYENGDGVPQDLEKAEYWYTKAAEQGNEEAQINLDDLLKNG